MKLVKSIRFFLAVAVMVLAISEVSYAQQTATLHHFQSEVQGNTIAFDWSVANGDQVKSFGLERAGADFRFETVGTVTVRPTHRASSTYRFTDAKPLSGAAFYRLKITDHHGNVAYCKIVSQTAAPAYPAGR